jgi:hypothetical protein
MRSGEPWKSSSDRSAHRRPGRWRLLGPGSKAARDVTARALPRPGYARRRQECSGRGLAAPVRASAARRAGRMLRRGVSHAGK